jgi:hypothetical protein
MTRVEAGQQNAVTRLQEAIAAGDSKANQDITNLERELAKLKEEMRATRPKAEPLARSVAAGAVLPTRPPPPTAKPAPDAPVAPPPIPATRKPSSDSQTSSSSSAPATPPTKPAPVKISPPPRPPKPAKQFPPSVKEGGQFGVPDGIIAHLTRECGGNVHDRNVVEVTSGSFEKETHGANPHSGAFNNNPTYAAKNAANLKTDSYFRSAHRDKKEDIPHMRNSWICYDFKERRIVPTHYTIRTNFYGPFAEHLKSWLIETSTDGKIWREAARKRGNNQLNGSRFTATFPVAGSAAASGW